MSTDTHTHLISLSDAYGAHMIISRCRVSFLARGDGMFFKRLSEGSSCTLRNATTVMQWFSNNWPSDLEWPPHIPRPAKSKKQAA